MRILICSNAYPPDFVGGAELIAHYQGLTLRAAGHEVRAFAGDTRGTAPRYATADGDCDGIPVRRIRLTADDFNPAHANFCHPAVEASFAALVSDFRPDVVHFHNLIGLSVKIVHLAREAGATTVVTLHDHWGYCFKNTALVTEGEQCEDATACRRCQQVIDDGRGRRIPMRMRQDSFALLAGSVDAFVSPSRYLADSYVAAGFPAGRMHVVWNGIDVERFAKVRRVRSDGPLRFSFIGHFGRHKGVHTLLQALPLVSSRADLRINLVGDGEERADYERVLAANGWARRVRFWGKVDNSRIDDVYAETDVLVLPSIWRENQPVSITEAMASGCAVIASDMGGNCELVADGVTGYLFTAGDAAQLAERMSRFVDHPDLPERMGRDGRRRISPCSLQAQVGELLGVYSSAGRQSSPLRPQSPLVACFGDRVHADAALALDLIAGYCPEVPVRVTMSEWLTAAQLRSALALWVVDDRADVEEALALAAAYGLPLIVPAASEGLTWACRAARCGLHYADADEAAAGVAYLLTHDQDRMLLSNAARALHFGDDALRIAGQPP